MLIRLPKRQFAVLVAGWAAAGAVVLSLVLAGRETALERGARSIAAMAALVELDTARTFQVINLTLGAIVDAHHLEPRPARNDPEFQEMMARRLQDMPFLRALFIIDADGWIVHDTDYPRSPRASLADRPYFRRHQTEPALVHSVSAPMLSRAETGWFVAVTRRLSHSVGFEGIAVAALQADHFSRQYDGIGLLSTEVIALSHDSGALVAQHPANARQVGQRFDGWPLFAAHLSKSPSGTFSTAQGLAPGERIVGYRKVADTPFVVWASRTETALLTDWRRTAIGALVAMGALTLMMALFVAYVIREHAREERARQRREQAGKLEALGQLTGGIAHDFGNLLNVMSMALATLRQHPDDPPLAAQALAVAEHALGRGTGLIARLLAFGKRVPLQTRPIDLNQALALAKPLLDQAAGRAQVELEPGAALPPVLCDTDLLEVALVNLVVNSRDAMGGSGRIVIRTYPCDDDNEPLVLPGGPAAQFVCLAVQDFGPGMAASVRSRVLEPFFSTKGSGGTGLGLPQVYAFMERLGGSLRIDSVPGEGTTVHLFFPVMQ